MGPFFVITKNSSGISSLLEILAIPILPIFIPSSSCTDPMEAGTEKEVPFLFIVNEVSLSGIEEISSTNSYQVLITLSPTLII